MSETVRLPGHTPAAPPTWDDDAPDPLLGVLVAGRYRIEARLGRGGMGAVYRARHVALDKPVALKALHPELAADETVQKRFLQEARIAAAIKHDHLVDVSDFGEITREECPALGPLRQAWFTMELLEGETLAQRVAREPLDAEEATRIFREAAEGVAAAHDKGAIHRDLKPDNVFLANEQGRQVTKVLDFGVAKVRTAGKLTQKGIVFGTPFYMSPEQASDQDLDGRSDIYALGVVMYEALSGRLPFEGDTYMGVLTKHVFARPEPIELVVADRASLGQLGPVIMRCLEKRPDARYPSAHHLAAALRSIESGYPPPLEERPLPLLQLREREAPVGRVALPVPSSARAGWFVGVGAVVGLAAVAGAWWATRSDEAPATAPRAAASAAASTSPLKAPEPRVVPTTAPPRPVETQTALRPLPPREPIVVPVPTPLPPPVTAPVPPPPVETVAPVEPPPPPRPTSTNEPIRIF